MGKTCSDVMFATYFNTFHAGEFVLRYCFQNFYLLGLHRTEQVHFVWIYTAV